MHFLAVVGLCYEIWHVLAYTLIRVQPLAAALQNYECLCRSKKLTTIRFNGIASFCVVQLV